VSEAGGDWLSAPEVAKLLRLELHTVHALINRGELQAEVTNTGRPRARRAIRIQREAVDDLIERVRVKPGDLRHLHSDGPPMSQAIERTPEA
jgi:excisionase family DNA binding protein